MTRRKGGLKAATQEYLDRQERKIHPDGKFDGAGRWYPDDSERRPCCLNIRALPVISVLVYDTLPIRMTQLKRVIDTLRQEIDYDLELCRECDCDNYDVMARLSVCEKIEKFALNLKLEV